MVDKVGTDTTETGDVADVSEFETLAGLDFDADEGDENSSQEAEPKTGDESTETTEVDGENSEEKVSEEGESGVATEDAGAEETTEQTETPNETDTEDPAQQEATSTEQEVAVQGEGEQTLTPEQQAEQLAAFDVQAKDLLAKEVYQISEEDLVAFEEDPGKMLPQFAANLHLQVMRAATQNIARLLPEMVQQIQATQQTTKQLETQFYEANPALQGHEETVLKFGRVYAELNPQATQADFIRDVGAQVSVALGIHQQQAAQEAKPVKAAPVTPPHKPAKVGAAPQTSAPETNEFTLFALEEED